MANRKARRSKPRGASYADVLAYKRALKEASQKAADDTTLQVKADIQTIRAIWMCCVAMNRAFGIGAKRFNKQFAPELQGIVDWYEELKTNVDEDTANEKLRREASRCAGFEVKSLCDDDMMAEIRKNVIGK